MASIFSFMFIMLSFMALLNCPPVGSNSLHLITPFWTIMCLLGRLRNVYHILWHNMINVQEKEYLLCISTLETSWRKCRGLVSYINSTTNLNRYWEFTTLNGCEDLRGLNPFFFRDFEGRNPLSKEATPSPILYK